jgi:hypothetical protein
MFSRLSLNAAVSVAICAPWSAGTRGVTAVRSACRGGGSGADGRSRVVACSTGGLRLGFSDGGVTVTGGSTVPSPGCDGWDELAGGSVGFVSSGGPAGGVPEGAAVPGGIVPAEVGVSLGPCDAARPAKYNSMIAELLRSSRRFLRIDIAPPQRCTV